MDGDRTLKMGCGMDGARQCVLKRLLYDRDAVDVMDRNCSL